MIILVLAQDLLLDVPHKPLVVIRVRPEYSHARIVNLFALETTVPESNTRTMFVLPEAMQIYQKTMIAMHGHLTSDKAVIGARTCVFVLNKNLPIHRWGKRTASFVHTATLAVRVSAYVDDAGTLQWPPCHLLILWIVCRELSTMKVQDERLAMALERILIREVSVTHIGSPDITSPTVQDRNWTQ